MLASPPSWFAAIPINAPQAVPVESAGVIIPPTAPARRNSAVSTGLRTTATATATNGPAPSRLSSKMLLPLPRQQPRQGREVIFTGLVKVRADFGTPGRHDNCTGMPRPPPDARFAEMSATRLWRWISAETPV